MALPPSLQATESVDRPLRVRIAKATYKEHEVRAPPEARVMPQGDTCLLAVSQDACYDGVSTFRLKNEMVSERRGSLTPNRREKNAIFLLLVVYLGHGIFHPAAVLFFSKKS